LKTIIILSGSGQTLCSRSHHLITSARRPTLILFCFMVIVSMTAMTLWFSSSLKRLVARSRAYIVRSDEKIAESTTYKHLFWHGLKAARTSTVYIYTLPPQYVVLEHNKTHHGMSLSDTSKALSYSNNTCLP
jgi:ATP/ADP translocase